MWIFLSMIKEKKIILKIKNRIYHMSDEAKNEFYFFVLLRLIDLF